MIGIAHGAHKASSILGALRGEFVDVLITDEETAQLVLRCAEVNPPHGIVSNRAYN